MSDQPKKCSGLQEAAENQYKQTDWRKTGNHKASNKLAEKLTDGCFLHLELQMLDSGQRGLFKVKEKHLWLKNIEDGPHTHKEAEHEFKPTTFCNERANSASRDKRYLCTEISSM